MFTFVLNNFPTSPAPAIVNQYPVQLVVNGSIVQYEGTVEIRYNNTWGTICDDSWNFNDATVVCRMLGYAAAVGAWSQAHFGQGHGPIHLDDVHCLGTESDISDCIHSPWDSHNCQHSEDAGVSCTSKSCD